MHDFARASRFIWQGARVLEQRLFQHHFQAPDPDGVRTALAAYATPDGGYGHALEPDGRGPVSQPLHADFAISVLDEIGHLDPAAAAPICDHLAAIALPDGGLPNVLPSLRDYPRAPWWVIEDQPIGALIPAAHIAGLLCRNGIDHPWLSAAVEFCWTKIDAITGTHPYEVINALSFLDHTPDRDRATKAATRLGEIILANHYVLLDPDNPESANLAPGYAPGEYHYPHDYAPAPDSLARQWFSDTDFARSLDHLEKSQSEDGGWHVNFAQWNAVAHQEWNAINTIRTLLMLRRFGR